MNEELQTEEWRPRPKRTMSPEQKQRMREGRERAKAARLARRREIVEDVQSVPKQWTRPGMGRPPRPPAPKPPEPIPDPEPPPPTWDDEIEFLGMTGGQGWANHCCDDCNPTTGCVITREGSKICGHPEKGGLQAADLLRPKVMEVYTRARKFLAHQKADRRY